MIYDIRNCRKVAAQLLHGNILPPHPLCACKQTETSMVGNATTCANTRSTLCASLNYRKDLLNMCLACFETADNGLGECTAQTIRAVALVVSLNLCDTVPINDCSTEVITSPGHESSAYASLRPPFLQGIFSPPGNGIGGSGWYRSQPLQQPL